MGRGRPRKADPGSLYAFAHQFYWDFRQLDKGSIRWWRDQKKFEKLAAEAEADIQLSDEEKARAREATEEEIRLGRLSEDKRDERIRDMERAQLSATREWLRFTAAQDALKELKIPGEPQVVDALLNAETPDQVRQICVDAWVTIEREVQPGVVREITVRNWPISSGSVLPMYLSKYASEFIAARKDRRFPQSARRPSTRLKQLWFLSRALAGALYGIQTRTAVNLVGSKRPEQVFEESGAARPARGKRRRS
jgi:hypothetical protein